MTLFNRLCMGETTMEFSWYTPGTVVPLFDPDGNQIDILATVKRWTSRHLALIWAIWVERCTHIFTGVEQNGAEIKRKTNNLVLLFEQEVKRRCITAGLV